MAKKKSTTLPYENFSRETETFIINLEKPDFELMNTEKLSSVQSDFKNLADLVCNKYTTLIQKSVTLEDHEQLYLDVTFNSLDSKSVQISLDEGLGENPILPRQIFDNYNNPIFVVKGEAPFKLAYGNDLFFKVFGGDKKRFNDAYQNNFALAFPLNKRSLYIDQISSSLQRAGYCEMDVELELQSSLEWYYLNLQKIHNAENDYIFGMIVSVSHRRIVSEQLAIERKYLLALQELAKNELFKIDIKTLTFYNQTHNLEQSVLPEEIPNFPQYILDKQLIHPFDIDEFKSILEKACLGKVVSSSIRLRLSPDDFTWTQIDAKPIFNDDGDPVEIIGILRDVEDSVALKERATSDPLTGVLNKAAFRDSVELTIKNSHPELTHSFLFLDIDDFKYVNDNLGHSFGDFLLKLFSQRLKHKLREYDLVGRIGGDEFAILMKGVSDKEILKTKAESLLENIRREYRNDEASHTIKASVGIARFPEDGQTYDELYNNADIALYDSKKRGKNVVTIYTPALSAEKK